MMYNAGAELVSLSHAVGKHLKQLDTILGKGANVKPHVTKAPKKPKATDSLSFSGFFSGLESSLTGTRSSSKASSGQMMADLASAITKSINRDL
jgi:hypothetical protein